jgi:hypothetical protein
MITNIIQTQTGYKVQIDGVDSFIPYDIGNRHYEMIQEAISQGVEVQIEELETIIPNLSFAQLLIGLVSEGWITESEGEDWLKGILPPTVIAVIDQLPPNQRFVAKARAIRPTEVIRNDGLVMALAAYAGKTPEQLDQFFQMYSQV